MNIDDWQLIEESVAVLSALCLEIRLNDPRTRSIAGEINVADRPRCSGCGRIMYRFERGYEICRQCARTQGIIRACDKPLP